MYLFSPLPVSDSVRLLGAIEGEGGAGDLVHRVALLSPCIRDLENPNPGLASLRAHTRGCGQLHRCNILVH